MSTRKINNWWYVDFRHAHQRYRKKSPLNTRGGARAYEVQLRQRLAEGKPIGPGPTKAPTFATFAKQWFDTYVIVNNKPSEQHQKASILRRHLVPFFGRMQLVDITALKVETFKKQQMDAGLAPKTVNGQLSTLRRALGSAVEWELLDRLPRIQRLKAMPSSIVYVTAKECERLLADRNEPMWHEMVLVALHTGLRLSELFGLDWSALDFARGLVTVRQAYVRGMLTTTKSHRVRYVPMTSTLASRLGPRRQASGLVFSRPGGEPLGYCMAQKALDRLCARAEVRHIGWHALRHTYATQLVERGVPIRVVQDLMGHSTVQMTERYAHVAPSALHAAVRVLEEALPVEKMGNRWARALGGAAANTSQAG